MAKKDPDATSKDAATAGKGGETHQTAAGDEALTTNGGTPIADDQNSLRSGARGPTLLEDFVLREKITRGFAVKFYTEEGNFDLVGNNIPVFFIQDAIKFPDVAALLDDAAAVDWVRDAYGHLKVIGATAAARPLLTKASAAPDAGVVAVDGGDSIAGFIKAASKGRVWDRDDKLRPPV